MGLPQMLSKNANKNEIDISNLSIDELSKIYSKVEKEMLELSEQLEFEKAASLRDKLLKIEKQMLGIKV
jgi:excinuclease UvrABC helicase subunit UvrB